MSPRDAEPIRCALCGRELPGSLITEHHLVPRERGGTSEHTVPMCRPCHGHVHATYDNRTLEFAFSTIDALRRDPQIGKFVRFIRKQDPAAAFRSVTAKTHPSRRKRR